MVEKNPFPVKSPLISETLEEQLKALLGRLISPVELTCLVGEDEKSREMAAFINHISRLCDWLGCRFLAPGEDARLDAELDARLLPATGVAAPGQSQRMVFHGVPGGKEINAFAAALLTAGGGMKPLDKPTLKDIGKIKEPMTLQVCVSLGCQHCSQLVSNAQRVAWENPKVSAHMIDANLYPDLVREYGIERVPLTVINGKTRIPGGKTMAELTTLLVKSR